MSMRIQECFLEGIIENINHNLNLLRKAGMEIHDNENYEFCLEHIRYSHATDALIFHCKECELEHEEVMKLLKKGECKV